MSIEDRLRDIETRLDLIESNLLNVLDIIKNQQVINKHIHDTLTDTK